MFSWFLSFPSLFAIWESSSHYCCDFLLNQFCVLTASSVYFDSVIIFLFVLNLFRKLIHFYFILFFLSHWVIMYLFSFYIGYLSSWLSAYSWMLDLWALCWEQFSGWIFLLYLAVDYFWVFRIIFLFLYSDFPLKPDIFFTLVIFLRISKSSVCQYVSIQLLVALIQVCVWGDGPALWRGQCDVTSPHMISSFFQVHLWQ